VLPLKVADLFQESDDPVVSHTASREAARDRCAPHDWRNSDPA
jgi:hypothetical protein